MTIEQIEVNGTTYDIGLPGSDCPIICETFVADGHWHAEDAMLSLHDKHFNEDNVDYDYQQLDPELLFIRTDHNTSEKTIVIAVPVDGTTEEGSGEEESGEE